MTQFEVAGELRACGDMAYADGDPKTGRQVLRAAASVAAGYYREGDDILDDSLVRYPGGATYVRLAKEAMAKLTGNGR